ncbi:hypothetical protein DKP76_14725 [Falsochrobactrum shanghaiense]|uniref:Uncharacterized protein n=1 Tax=Falsochrobactrum shanghaiense TaxID=2201899 RepID=A0A316J7P1_9HYPH|nr:hypothetical protein [Falsochrobactrum shanghaiense]PWL16765.1 hypothetical protein DKP76_14725 [Falsochrobactrum shanghaiense]
MAASKGLEWGLLKRNYQERAAQSPSYGIEAKWKQLSESASFVVFNAFAQMHWTKPSAAMTLSA